MGWAALLFRGLIREDVIFYQVLLSSSSYWWQNSILSSFECVCMHAKSLQLCRLFATPWTVAHQAPLSVGFSRQEHWSGLQCPPPQLCPGAYNGGSLESFGSWLTSYKHISCWNCPMAMAYRQHRMTYDHVLLCRLRNIKLLIQ